MPVTLAGLPITLYVVMPLSAPVINHPTPAVAPVPMGTPPGLPREVCYAAHDHTKFNWNGCRGDLESAAAIYTLIGTARLNDIEPYAYLKAVLERIAEHPINRIDELLPWAMDLPNPLRAAA